MKSHLIYILIGIAIGAFLMHWLFFPDVSRETVVDTKIETDTVYVTEVDTVYRNKLITRYLRDTVYVTGYDTINLPVKSFSEKFNVQYGSITAFGETIGDLSKLNIATDFKLPTITNRITETKTVTNTIDPKGIYIGGGIGSKIEFKVGATYLDKDWMINYDYELKPKIHWIGVKKKLF